MAKNTNPVFGLNGVAKSVTLAAANTAGDGSGTIPTIITGDTNGTRISNIQIISAQATVATNSLMVVRLWLSTDGGTTWFKLREVLFTAIAGSNTVIGQFQELVFLEGLLLEGTLYRLGVTKSIHAGVQDQIHIMVRGTIQG